MDYPNCKSTFKQYGSNSNSCSNKSVHGIEAGLLAVRFVNPLVQIAEVTCAAMFWRVLHSLERKQQ